MRGSFIHGVTGATGAEAELTNRAVTAAGQSTATTAPRSEL